MHGGCVVQVHYLYGKVITLVSPLLGDGHYDVDFSRSLRHRNRQEQTTDDGISHELKRHFHFFPL